LDVKAEGQREKKMTKLASNDQASTQ